MFSNHRAILGMLAFWTRVYLAMFRRMRKWLEKTHPVEEQSMTGEACFLSAIEKDPSNQAHKQIYADWLDEQGRGSDGDAMRWLAAKGKSPFASGKEHGNGYIWFRCDEFTMVGYGLPHPLMAHTMESYWKIFDSFDAAIFAFFDAWSIATAQPSWFWRLLGYKAWVPDYREPKKPEELAISLVDEIRQLLNDQKASIQEARQSLESGYAELSSQLREIYHQPSS